jgi:hypothetical protein
MTARWPTRSPASSPASQRRSDGKETGATRPGARDRSRPSVGRERVDARHAAVGEVQEIIDRPGWVSGNPLAFIVTGSGRRTAVAFNGGAALAPRLHIEYTIS